MAKCKLYILGTRGAASPTEQNPIQKSSGSEEDAPGMANTQPKLLQCSLLPQKGLT